MVQRYRVIGLALVASALVLAGATCWHHGASPALPAEPGASIPEASSDELLALPADRGWQVRRLRGNSAVLVLQFPTLLDQGRTLNRAAALIEKSGARRDRVLTDTELMSVIAAAGDSESSYFLGHDYRAVDLARFFAMAQAQRVPLNTQELRLRELLVDAGLLQRGAPGQFMGLADRALVSFSAAGLDDPALAPDERMDSRRRESVLLHELSHGRYFTDSQYRERTNRFWRESLTDADRWIWRRYLTGLGYDASNEDLLANETQALLMHTPDRRDFDAAALGVTEDALEAWRTRFRLALR